VVKGGRNEADHQRNQLWQQIYSETPPADIPWNIEIPPKALVGLVESGRMQPCKTIDLGCGAGNYAIYLASAGFDVTGVDISLWNAR
jgi:2-polyprenyl-3-methyl-5-hydroxy-6-metoxy-1,4-benzoquinol methylase